MSRFGARRGRKLPGAEFTWDHEPNGEFDNAPTPLFPKYPVPQARTFNPREQSGVNWYKTLRERFREGPYYAVIDVASTSAKKGSAARARFDPFYGMPSYYAEKYQKRTRTVPGLEGRPYIMKFFPRELWPAIQPSYKPEIAAGADSIKRLGIKRGFEDDEDEDEEEAVKRKKADEDEDALGGRRKSDDEGDRLEEDEEQEEELVDNDFEDDDDEMGGDYNAEQYFDAGDDEGDGDGFADGGGGYDDHETY